MKQNINNQPTTILSIALFSIAIMVSGSVFAVDSTPDRVTQSEFNAAIANLQAKINKLNTKKKVGDHFGGGIVFYVDPTGQHGLIAAPHDSEVTHEWCDVNTTTNATGDGIGAGVSNTSIIVGVCGPNSAAKYAADLQVGTYGDWYLPSKRELYQLWLERDVVGGFGGDQYWSSTEYDVYNNTAWNQILNDGNFSGGQNRIAKTDPYSVRAIRAF